MESMVALKNVNEVRENKIQIREACLPAILILPGDLVEGQCFEEFPPCAKQECLPKRNPSSKYLISPLF